MRRALALVGALGLGLPLAAAPPASAAADGDVLAWGNDEDHQLGDGGFNSNSSMPTPVLGLEVGSGVVAVSGGARHSLALRLDGSVLSWGNNFFGELGRGHWGYGGGAAQVVGLGPGSGVVAVAAGGAHNLALRSDGGVVAWGDGFDGQIGDGESEYGGELTPVPVTGLGAGSGVVAVAAGDAHSLALRSDGSVLSWGSDSYGQLGAGGEHREPAPVPVSGLGPGSGVVAIAASAYLTVWPTGKSRPTTSSLNVPAGDIRANMVTVRLGASGWVSFFNAAGTTDVLVDVAGWYGGPGV